jgi:hypothetical protein
MRRTNVTVERRRETRTQDLLEDGIGVIGALLFRRLLLRLRPQVLQQVSV